jgi:hypothetical protein
MRLRNTLPCLLLLAACATAPVVPSPFAPDAARAAAATGVGDATVAATTPPRRKLLGGGSYTRGKFGAFLPSGDLDPLDDGIYGEIAIGTGLVPLVSADLSLGYLGADAGGGEYRYLTSEETDAGFTIEGHALLVTATLPF